MKPVGFKSSREIASPDAPEIKAQEVEAAQPKQSPDTVETVVSEENEVPSVREKVEWRKTNPQLRSRSHQKAVRRLQLAPLNTKKHRTKHKLLFPAETASVTTVQDSVVLEARTHETGAATDGQNSDFTNSGGQP
ncbi:hypothetical protein MRX96_030879 [Rhipicephalus microplus]